MRAAGRGRIVVVSSQGGVRGMPAIGAYSASKGALERWAEALAQEVAPFGLGVTILVAGTFKTDILTERTPTYADPHGPYAAHDAGRHDQPRDPAPGDSPERFARALARALDERAPFARHAVGLDAKMLLFGRSPPARPAPSSDGRSGALGLPKPGSLSGEAPRAAELVSRRSSRAPRGLSWRTRFSGIHRSSNTAHAADVGGGALDPELGGASELPQSSALRSRRRMANELPRLAVSGGTPGSTPAGCCTRR